MVKRRYGYKYFTSSDLASIKRRTNNNNHTVNYIFIAEKIGYPTKGLEEVKRSSEQAGYLVDFDKQYRIYQKMMGYFKNIASPQEYRAVYSRL